MFGKGERLRLKAPPATVKQVWSDGGMDFAGADLIEHNFANAPIEMTARVRVMEPGGAMSRGRAATDKVVTKLTQMFEDARLWHGRRHNTGRRCVLIEDLLGEERISEIVGGTVSIIDSLDSSVIDQGYVSLQISMTRKPFRYPNWVNGWGLEGERLCNLFQEPSFLQNQKGGGAGAQFADHWFEIDPGAQVSGDLITTDYLQGGQCQQVAIIAPGVAGDCGIRTTRTGLGDSGYEIPVTASIDYHMVIRLRHRTVGGDPVRIRVWDITNGAWVVPGAPDLLTFNYAEDGWEKQYVTWTAPAGCALASVYAYVPNADRAAGVTFLIDKLMMGDDRDRVYTKLTFEGWASASKIQPHWDEDGNHGAGTDDQSHTNLIDVEDVIGQVPAIPNIWIRGTNSMQTGLGSATIGAKWQDILDFEHWRDYQGNVLAGASGGEYALQAVNNTTWTHLPAPAGNIDPMVVQAPGNYGQFLVFVKMGCTTVPNAFWLRAEYGPYDPTTRQWVVGSGLTEPVYVNQTPNTGMRNWLFLGVVYFNRRDYDFHQGEVTPDQFGIGTWIYQASGGALNFWIDFMCLVPTEGGVQRTIQPSIIWGGPGPAGEAILMGWDDRVRSMYNPAGTEMWGPWPYRGATPRLYHRGPTRLIYQPFGSSNCPTPDNVEDRLPTKIDWRPTYL